MASMPQKTVLLLLADLLREQSEKITELASEMPDEYLTPREYADRNGLDRQTVYRHLDSGKLAGEKVGGSWRIPV